ncbi:hypothetical protein PybrP1_011449 [[Pythium] brassicae (nom. inval.)]|nr:hypothetical protein PybrP1_011449 [[Pythium] brassicae (nom. inval.)]
MRLTLTAGAQLTTANICAGADFQALAATQPGSGPVIAAGNSMVRSPTRSVMLFQASTNDKDLYEKNKFTNGIAEWITTWDAYCEAALQFPDDDWRILTWSWKP